jgi:hypothetical protein
MSVDRWIYEHAVDGHGAWRHMPVARRDFPPAAFSLRWDLNEFLVQTCMKQWFEWIGHNISNHRVCD